MRAAAVLLALLAAAGPLGAGGCGGRGRAAPLGSAPPPTIGTVPVERVVDLADRYLDARAAWRAAGHALDATDYDRGWADLDPTQRDAYVAAADEVLELAHDAISAAIEAGADAHAAAVRTSLAAAEAARRGSMADPPADLGGAIDRTLVAVRGAVAALGDRALPGAAGRCVVGRVAVVEGLADHTDGIGDAIVTAEMAATEAGYPPGSIEQAETDAETARLVTDLERWRGWIDDQAAVLAGPAPAPVPALDRPPLRAPEPIEDDWRAQVAIIATARTACAAPPGPTADR